MSAVVEGLQSPILTGSIFNNIFQRGVLGIDIPKQIYPQINEQKMAKKGEGFEVITVRLHRMYGFVITGSGSRCR